MRYEFTLEVEKNDEFCMYSQTEESLIVLANDDIEAYNMMIEHCLNEGCQKFKVVDLKHS